MNSDDFSLTVNFLRVFIENNKKLSIKQKDILSLQIMISVITTIGLFINFTFSMLWEFILEIIYSTIVLIKNIEEIFENYGQVMTMYRYTPQINFDFSVELKMLGVSVLYGLVNLFLFKYVKKDRGVIMMISLIFQIGTLCLIHDDIWKLVVCMVAFLFILVAVVPIGEGKYFNIIKYAEYFLDAFKECPVKFDKKLKKMYVVRSIKILVAWLFFLGTLIILFPILSFEMNLLISLSMVLVILMNTSNKMSKFLKKLFIYIIFIPIVLIGNNIVENDIFSMLILFITIFFTFDRIISLSKDMKEIIREYSIMYYIEEDNNELKNTMNLIFPVTFFYEDNFSELEIVRQMVFYYRMNCNDQFQELYNIYLKTSFHSYLFLLGGMNYYLVFGDEELEERETYLKNLFASIQEFKQKVNFVPISVEYAYILYQQQKEYQLIYDILKPIEQTLDDEMKGILKTVQVEQV